jgi:hypothetical protein
MCRQITALIALALLLVSCGGGGGGTSDPVPPPPPASFALVAASPADSASNVARDSNYVASFNYPIDPATVGNASIRLIGPESNSIPATVSVNGASITVAAPLGLPGNTVYRVDIAGSIANAKGALLPRAYSTTFATAPQSWQPAPTALGSLNQLASNDVPWLKADRSGNVVAVWLDRSLPAFVAARMDATTGAWSEPVRLGLTEEIGSVSVALGPRGEAYLAWSAFREDQSEHTSIATFDPVQRKWSAVADIPGVSNAVSLAADPASNLTLFSIVDAAVFATRYDAVTAAWGSQVQVDTASSSAYAVSEIRVATDARGNVIAAWSQQFDEGRALFVAHYSNGIWSAPQRLDNSVPDDTISLSVDPAGNAALAWCHDYPAGDLADGRMPTAMVSRYPPGASAWSAPARIDQTPDDSDGTSFANVVIDAAGIATATWAQADGLYASRYDTAAQAWSAPQQVTNRKVTVDPAAVVDAAGNVTLAFAESGSMTALQFLVRDRQWHAAAIGQPAAGAAVLANNAPVMAIDGGGGITIAWAAAWQTGENAWQYPVLANRFK